MKKTLLKDIYKKEQPKTICHYQIFQPSESSTRQIGLAFYKDATILGNAIPCGQECYELVNGIPLCKEHAEYAKFFL